MAGQTFVLLERQVVDFSHLLKTVVETRVLVGKIPTVQYTSLQFLVRIHNVGIPATGGGTIGVQLVVDASTDADPANKFLGGAALNGGSVTIQGNSTAGSFSLTAVNGTFGSAVALQLVGTQNNTTDYLPLAAEISVELILKSA